MEVVRAALGDDVHHAAVAPAILGLVALRDEVKFLDRLEREELQEAADRVVVVVAAVDLVVDVAAVAAANLRRVLRALGRVGVVAKADARNHHRGVGELPAVQRQILNPVDVDHPADRRRGGLDEWCLGADRDRLRHRRQLEGEVEIEGLADVDHDALVLDLGEPRQLGGQVVAADRKRRQPEYALAVGHVGSHKARREILSDHCDSRDRSSLIVKNAPGDAPRRLLRDSRCCSQPDRAKDDHRRDELFHA